MSDLHPDKLVEELRHLLKFTQFLPADHRTMAEAANTIEALQAENRCMELEIDERRKSYNDAMARLDRVTEALTPNEGTKAAYIGEFLFNVEGFDEYGNSIPLEVTVPWTTIKEIMAAIRARAEALNGERM